MALENDYYINKYAELALRFMQIQQMEEAKDLLEYLMDNTLYEAFLKDRLNEMNYMQRIEYLKAAAALYAVSRHICEERGWKDEVEEQKRKIMGYLEEMEKSGMTQEEFFEDLKRKGKLDEEI